MNTEDRHSGTEEGWVVRWQSRIKRNSVSKFRRIAHHPEIVRSGGWERAMGGARASKRDLKKQR